MPPFKITPYTKWDKRIEIIGPDGLRFFIDHDDVDTDLVEEQTQKLVQILNDHWPSSD